MTRSYKILVLLAMLNADRFPGEISIQDLSGAVRRVAERSATLKTDLSVDLSDEAALRRLLETNPIQAWVGGKGTGQVPYFRYENGNLSTIMRSSEPNRQALQQLTRELAEWRLAEYLRRADSSADAEGRFECKVSHSDGRPILFLPDRAANSTIPEGWVNVKIDGERYEANFVKIAVNVIRSSGSDTNQLPELMRGWFGADAGLPGTDHRVVFETHKGELVLTPVSRRDGALQLWRRYSREEIPKLFGLTYSAAVWQQGFVLQGGQMVLLVTLDKGQHAEKFKYRDQFLAPDRFQWQSQNRTTQASKHGQTIRGHQQLGVPVHLFVRSKTRGANGTAAPFLYAGQVEFVSWQGERPITVQWRLTTPVPTELMQALNVPQP